MFVSLSARETIFKSLADIPIRRGNIAAQRWKILRLFENRTSYRHHSDLDRFVIIIWCSEELRVSICEGYICKNLPAHHASIAQLVERGTSTPGYAEVYGSTPYGGNPT